MTESMYDVDLEWDVIASCVWMPEVIPETMRNLSTADFGSEGTAQVWEAVKSAQKKGAVDAFLVRDELQARGADPKLILELFDSDREARSMAQNAPRHGKTLHKLSLLRRIAALGVTTTDLVKPGADPDEVIVTLTRMLSALGQETQTSYSNIADLTREVEAYYDARRKEARTIPTKLPSVDRALDGGLQPGRFYVVGAQPGVGKSTMLSSIARTALDRELPVLFASLEMTGQEIMQRMLSNAYAIDSRITTDVLNAMWSDRTRAWPLVYTSKPDVAHITTLARGKLDLKLLVVDYLQLLRPGGRSPSREREIAEITRDLKLLAIELDVPILAASQVNRAPSGRSDDKPRLSDLRESGSIENDADVVMLLHRKAAATRGTLNVAKNRHGRTGITDVEFVASTMAFHEVQT